jgi:formate dehydrogenase assembly factor FdhD
LRAAARDRRPRQPGAHRRISIPAERPLTVFVDRRELVSPMTLGAMPERLVPGCATSRTGRRTAR